MQMVNTTTFECKICGQQLEFLITDPSSYISMKKQESFFGMELNTFRIAHTFAGFRHINSVIVDHKGLFRGFVDAYEEQADVHEQMDFEKLEHNEKTKDLNVPFLQFLLVEYEQGRVIEYLNKDQIEVSRFLDMVTKKIDETKKLYKNRHTIFFSLADLDVNVVYKDSWAIVYTTKGERKNWDGILYQILVLITGERDEAILPSTLQLLLLIAEKVGIEALREESVAELVTNPYLDVVIDAKYPQLIPRVIARIHKDFQIPEETLNSLFGGEITLLGAIEKHPEMFESFLNMIKFVNRRKLLG